MVIVSDVRQVSKHFHFTFLLFLFFSAVSKTIVCACAPHKTSNEIGENVCIDITQVPSTSSCTIGKSPSESAIRQIEFTIFDWQIEIQLHYKIQSWFPFDRIVQQILCKQSSQSSDARTHTAVASITICHKRQYHFGACESIRTLELGRVCRGVGF